MTNHPIRCPTCNKNLEKVGQFWHCPEHGQIFSEKSLVPLRIFISYGHDNNVELISHIITDLTNRGHEVCIDKICIKPFDDWRRQITNCIIHSQKFVSILSKHSTRDHGVCLDEIAIAIRVKGGNIQTILVESENEVKTPPSVSHIQWLDMHDWKEKYSSGEEVWNAWYQAKLAEIVAVVESDESRRFAGEIKTLEEYLKPISSTSRINELLAREMVGRGWIFDEIEKWRKDSDRRSRLFWIKGDPGFGKSAFIAHLAHYHGAEVISVQFCEWDKPDHRNANRVVQTLAFQIATRLPDYRKFLLTLPEIKNLDRKNASELFDYLIANPLRNTIGCDRERYLVVIDALDEASENGRNELVEMLVRNAPRLPDWIGIIISSRPKSEVIAPLQGLNPLELETKTELNLADIREYLHRELETQLENRPDTQWLVEQILEKSEGVFLYAERFCNDVKLRYISLDRPEQFPKGLGEIFFQYFRRQFPEMENYRKDVRPVLRAILAAREPLPMDIFQRIFNWQDEELCDLTHILGSLFPITTEYGNEVIKPYHKSLAEWLADKKKSYDYFVSVKEGNKILAADGWAEYHKNGTNNLSRYYSYHLPFHLLAEKRFADLVDLLRDPLVFTLIWERNQFDIKQYWAAIEQQSSIRAIEVYKEIIKNPGKCEDTTFLLHLSEFLIDAHQFLITIPILEHLVIKYLQKEENQKLLELAIDELAWSLILQTRESPNLQKDYARAWELIKFGEYYYRNNELLYGLQVLFGYQAMIYRKRGNIPRALDCYHMQQNICKQLKDDKWLQMSLGNEGSLILENCENYDGALDLYNQKLEISKKIGDLRGYQYANSYLGHFYERKKDRIKALSYYEEQLKVAQGIGYKKGILESLEDQIRVNKIMNNTLVVKKLTKMRDDVQSTLIKDYEIRISSDNSQIFNSVSDYYLSQADQYRRSGDHERLCEQLANLATIACVKGNTKAVSNYLAEPALQKDTPASQRAKENVNRNLWQLYYDQNKLAQSFDVFVQSNLINNRMLFPEELQTYLDTCVDFFHANAMYQKEKEANELKEGIKRMIEKTNRELKSNRC